VRRHLRPNKLILYICTSDVIYGLTSSDCTSAYPGVTKGDQDVPLDSGEKVKVVESIPKVHKLLLAAGLKVSIEIGEYSYFFKIRKITGLRTCILHHVMHSKSSEKVLKNTVKIMSSKKKTLSQNLYQKHWKQWIKHKKPTLQEFTKPLT
jgi:hypothetical protein